MPSPADIPPGLLDLLRAAFHSNLEAADLLLLKRGNYANANVHRARIDGRDWAIKEFLSRPWLVRHTLGRFLIRREARVLAALDGIAGIPRDGRRLGPAALAMAFVAGKALADLRREGGQLPRSFFLDLERLVDDIHAAGYAHLDVRNLGNIICGPDQRPCLLDFQSSVRTQRLPQWLRRIMEDTDRSGIYKCWRKLCPEPLDPERDAFRQRFQRTRKLWVFKGYWLGKTWKKLSRSRATPPTG